MTTKERLAIVAAVCAQLWRQQEWISTDLATDRLIWRAEWDADGYRGAYPWSRARRYVRTFLRGMKDNGLVEVMTAGTDHYNAGGTLVDYALTEAGQRWLTALERQERGGEEWAP